MSAVQINTAAPIQSVHNKPAVAPQQSVGQFVQAKADQSLGKQQEVNAPAVREGRPAPAAYDKAAIKEQQTQFLADMEARGIKASNPPSEADLKKYFASYNNDADRGKALDQFENYTRAFHVHTAERKGHETDDVKYSPEQSYYYNGEVYNKKADAVAAQKANNNEGVLGTVNSADASSWSDVSKRPDLNGRKVQDCEGFAYMSQSLLGAAGYEVTQSNNVGADGAAHSMTVVKDPSSGKLAVTSNDKVITGGDQNQMLTKGWEYAGGTSDPGTFYTGKTQAEAQTRQQAAAHNW